MADWEWYILNDKNQAVPVDAKTWGYWFEAATRSRRRIVAQEVIGDFYSISTVFIGLDHGFRGIPLLFETMIFVPDEEDDERMEDIWMERCGTWSEAEDVHERAVEY